MKKREQFIAALLMAGLCLSLSGCGYLAGKELLPEQPGGAGPTVAETPDSGALNGVREYISGHVVSPKGLTADPLQVNSGELAFSVESVRAVTDLSAEEISLDCIARGDAFVPAGETDLTFDEYYDAETGALAEGVYLILLDLTVTSRGAVSGMYQDSGVFRADALLWLVNGETSIEQAGKTTYVQPYSVDYFSGYGQRPEGCWAFRVPDGGSVSIQVGYFITHTGDPLGDIWGCRKSFGEYDKLEYIDLNNCP